MTHTCILAYYVVSRILFSFCLETFLTNDFRIGHWTIPSTVLSLRMPCAPLYFWRICSLDSMFLGGCSTFFFQSWKKCDTFLCPKGFDKEFIVIQTNFPAQEAVVSITPVLPVFFLCLWFHKFDCNGPCYNSLLFVQCELC